MRETPPSRWLVSSMMRRRSSCVAMRYSLPEHRLYTSFQTTGRACIDPVGSCSVLYRRVLSVILCWGPSFSQLRSPAGARCHREHASKQAELPHFMHNSPIPIIPPPSARLHGHFAARVGATGLHFLRRGVGDVAGVACLQVRLYLPAFAFAVGGSLSSRHAYNCRSMLRRRSSHLVRDNGAWPSEVFSVWAGMCR